MILFSEYFENNVNCDQKICAYTLNYLPGNGLMNL